MNYIYVIANKSNGKFYIGRTNKPAARKRCHWSELNRGVHGNPRLQNAWNKYGKNTFEFTVIDSAPESEIEAKEAEWFAKFDHDKAFLYNCHFETHGGPKIWGPMSEDAKLKISESIKNGTRKYIFEILDEGYSSKLGLNKLARKHSVGSTTLLSYVKEWEQLRGMEYGHPQTRTTLERLSAFADEFKKIGPEVTRRMKEFGVSYKAIDKYGKRFGLTLQNIRLDGWKNKSIAKAKSAYEYKKEHGCSVLDALKATGATVTTYYKYLPTFA